MGGDEGEGWVDLADEFGIDIPPQGQGLNAF